MARWTQLGQVSEVAQGVLIGRHKDDAGEEVAVIQTRHLDWLRVSGEPDLIRLGSVPPSQYLHSGQILLSLRGPPVRASVVTSKQAGCVASSNLAVISVENSTEAPNPFYVAGLLRSRFLDHYFLQQTGGGKLPSLNLRTVRSLELPLPSVDKQDALADTFIALEQYTDLAYSLIGLRTDQVEAELFSQLGRSDGT